MRNPHPVTDSVRLCELVLPGVMPYQEAAELQENLVKKISKGEEREKLLLLEHPHVITLGRGFHHENLLFSKEWLRERDVDVQECSRGGDVTYHGPGQVVGYPLLDISSKPDLHLYLRNLEKLMIECLGDFGIEAGIKKGMTGVWVNDRKIGAIGVRVTRWITSHGFALNVNTDLTYFDFIVPCGIRQYGVTSIERELGGPVALQQVYDSLQHHFQRIFGRKLVSSVSAMTAQAK